MTFQYRYRKQIIIGISIFVFICLITFLIIKNLPKKKNVVKKESDVSLKKEEDKKENDIYLKVDIKGEINNPGIYSLVVDSRVIDVINMAGGLTENADTTVLNLSKKIKDEMVIIVYSHEEVSHFKETKQIEKQEVESCVNGSDSSLKNDACIEDNSVENSLININSASLDELKSLPGIGDAKAKDIIKYLTRLKK